MNQSTSFFAHETAVIDPGCEIGEGTKIWHFTHVMPNCRIGRNCNLGQNVVVSPEVVLGNNVKVQNNVSIYTGVTCEDDVFLGPSAVFTNVSNPRSAVNRRALYEKTLVKRGASIGANATIVCGHTIGSFAFIGAGAVVTNCNSILVKIKFVPKLTHPPSLPGGISNHKRIVRNIFCHYSTRANHCPSADGYPWQNCGVGSN